MTQVQRRNICYPDHGCSTCNLALNVQAVLEMFECNCYIHTYSPGAGADYPLGSEFSYHYANMPMQYTAISHGSKNDNFQMKNCDIFLIFAQNIDFGYTLEPPHLGGSNVYPQTMF